MKRFICLLIVACMAFSALPLNIFAQEGYILDDEQLTDNAMSELEQERFYSFSEDVGLGQIYVSATYSPVLTYASGYMSEEEAVSLLRENMKNRVSIITLKFKSSTRPQDILTKIVNLAAAHTGSPTEGDYIMWQFSRIGASFSYGSSGGSYYYEMPLQVEYFTTKAQENQVDKAVKSILQELNVYDAPDYDKISAVYDYICQNVTYDFENLEDDTYLLKHSAYAAFVNKTAVCQGYALMFYRLMLELGVDCRIITGTSFGVPHAWNIVRLDNKYYNIDSTWDAGYNEYLYFLKRQDEFEDHDRDPEYTSDEFNQKYPMAGENPFKIVDGVLVDYRGEGVSDIVIPDGVIKIGPEAFAHNSEIISVTVPEGVTSIDNWVFQFCTNLETVTLPSTLESIGRYVFSFCYDLKQINIPENVTSIGDNAFWHCRSVKDIVLPEGLIYLGPYAFSGCRSLESINIPKSITEILDYTFESCSDLKEVILHRNVATIAENAFLGVEGNIKFFNPQTVIFDTENTLSGATIYGFSNSTANKYAKKWSMPFIPFDSDTIIASGTCGENLTWELNALYTLTIKGTGEMTSAPWKTDYNKSIKNVILEEGVTSICDNAFSFSDISGIALPSTLEHIGNKALYYCNYLENVSLPDGLKSIGEWAFSYCPRLTEVVIPKSVTNIGMDTLQSCSNLKKIYVYSKDTAINSSSGTFPEGATIYGYDNSTAQSYAKMYQREFVSLGSAHVASGTCGDNVTWLLTEDGTLTISGEGEMTDYAYLDTSLGQIVRSPWNEYAELITSVHVETGVTSIGDDSFYNCINLTEVILPEGLTDIGKFAFDGCKSLESIKIPRGVTIIDDGAFNECDKLTDVIIPDSVTDIGIGAFMDCDSLTSITIPDSVESIERNAFDRNPNLISITFESATTEIYDSLYTISDSATIYGHADSTAQAYAEKYGREFVDLSTLYTVGDLDGNDSIDNNDAIYLLYYTIFGEEGGYTVNQPCDFDGSGEVDNNDAIYLLYHTIFGAEEYPLNLQ